MIDLHTHTFLSDGVFVPCEMVRRAEVAGYSVVALTDHVDGSNVEQVVGQIAKMCDDINALGGIQVIAGAEITHVPPKLTGSVADRARKAGARLIVVHGETVVEPVAEGTNAAAIECGVDILAHPGLITEQEACQAAEMGVYLEITSRRGHCLTNGYVAKIAFKTGAKLVLNTDAHAGGDLFSEQLWLKTALGAGILEEELDQVRNNSKLLAESKLS
jgi:histidinol phosphatase-like PHP family hydrolase